MHHPQDLVVAADDRVQLPFSGQLGQVTAVLLQGAVAALGVGIGHPLPTAHFLYGLVDALLGHPSFTEDARGGGVLLAGDGQEDVLCGDVSVLQSVGFLVGQVNDPFEAGGDVNLTQSASGEGRHFGAGFQHPVQTILYGVDVGSQVLQNLGDDAFWLLQKGQQNVLCIHLVVAVAL